MNAKEYATQVANLTEQASRQFGSSLTVAGDSSVAALATVGNAAGDWSRIASGDPKAIGQLASLAISAAPAVLTSAVSALGSAGQAVAAVADSIPIVGQFFSFASALGDALSSIDKQDEAEELAKQSAALAWCRQTQWAPVGSGETGRIYPADFFNAPRDLYGNARKFPPPPTNAGGIEAQGGRVMPHVGRTLILALEGPPQDLPNDLRIGVSSEARRKWFRATRLAIQNAPAGSDGGLLLWPAYVDLAMDEFLNGGVRWRNKPWATWKNQDDAPTWTPEIGWQWYIANVNNAKPDPANDFVPSGCDSRGELVQQTWNAISGFLTQWKQTWVTPKFAPAQEARRKLLATTQQNVIRSLRLSSSKAPEAKRDTSAQRRRVVVAGGSALLLTGAAFLLRSGAWRFILSRATAT